MNTKNENDVMLGKVRLRHAVAKALFQLYGFQSRRL